MKVMISYPPLKGKGSPMLTQNRQFQWYHVPSFIYPVTAAMAATLLEQEGFEVVWNDCIAEKLGEDEFISLIDREKPDIMAFETKTPVVRQHWNVVERLKESRPEASLILFGDHVTALPAESMKQSRVDYVVTGGDYDVSLLAVAKRIRDGGELPGGIWYRENGEIRDTGQFDLKADLNNLPFVNRRLTKAHLYGEKWKKRKRFFYTMAGRDCQWHKCTFCAWTTIYPTFRARSPEHLLDEIGMLIDTHGAQEIFDDTGTFPTGNWLRKFCRGMIERGYNRRILFSANMRYGLLQPDHVKLMKEAGFRKLKMGLESANQGTLNLIRKGIKVEDIVEGSKMISESGIDIQLTVMVGYPWETKDDAQRTVDLARELMGRGHAEMLQSTVVVP
ncbi:MAG: radical SAM protein, partial [Candidatus Hydrogenedentota bacterium]